MATGRMTSLRFSTWTGPGRGAGGAEQREREAVTAHDGHLQRERDDVRVGRRERARDREAAEPRVGDEVVDVDAYAGPRVAQVGQRAAGVAPPEGGGRVDAAEVRRRLEGDLLGHRRLTP